MADGVVVLAAGDVNGDNVEVWEADVNADESKLSKVAFPSNKSPFENGVEYASSNNGEDPPVFVLKVTRTSWEDVKGKEVWLRGGGRNRGSCLLGWCA